MKTAPPRGVIDGLVSLVQSGEATKATSKTSDYDVTVYKVPSSNLNKYTIRVDIKVGKDN